MSYSLLNGDKDMTQYKKDLVKESIDTAALSVFASKGYKGAKIADISDCARISVGNIYKYYKSKEEIFLSVVPESFIESIKEVLFKKIVLTASEKSLVLLESSEEFWLNNQEIIELLVENRERILIVLKNNRGTKYENTKDELIHFLIRAAEETSNLNHSNKENIGFVLNIIYNSLIDITLRVLEERNGIEEVKEGLLEITTYHLFGITGLLK
jgi:AcrR family transcriptional regulator